MSPREAARVARSAAGRRQPRPSFRRASLPPSRRPRPSAPTWRKGRRTPPCRPPARPRNPRQTDTRIPHRRSHGFPTSTRGHMFGSGSQHRHHMWFANTCTPRRSLGSPSATRGRASGRRSPHRHVPSFTNMCVPRRSHDSRAATHTTACPVGEDLGVVSLRSPKGVRCVEAAVSEPLFAAASPVAEALVVSTVRALGALSECWQHLLPKPHAQTVRGKGPHLAQVAYDGHIRTCCNRTVRKVCTAFDIQGRSQTCT